MTAPLIPIGIRRREWFRLEAEPGANVRKDAAQVSVDADAPRSAPRRSLPLRSRAGIVFGHIKEGGADVMAVSTPHQIMLDGSAVPQATRPQRLALSILQGEHLYDIEIGGTAWQHELADVSCGFCGGFFPKVGEVRYSAVFHEHLHVGCVVDAASWAHPLVPFPTRHQCDNGWTIEYASEKDDSLSLVRCPLCGGAA